MELGLNFNAYLEVDKNVNIFYSHIFYYFFTL